MSTLNLFLPLVKVDVDQRLVHGVATAEAPDRTGEVCDYASTKPYFEAWSDEARAASGGKSLGAVRAMHSRIAAGKLTDIAFDDEGKRILVAAKIIDDAEWEKVIEGVYTGFSQGGRYVARWVDETTGLTRFTADPIEISIVDVPCLPDATFEIVKDGVVEKRAFVVRAEAETPAPVAPKAEPVVAEVEPVAAPEPIAEAEPPTAPAGPSPTEALAKAVFALSRATDKLESAVDENSRLRASLAAMSPRVAALEKRLAALEAQPAPSRADLRSVSRAQDFGAEDAPGGGIESAIKRLADLPERERTLALMKVSLANPLTPRF